MEGRPSGEATRHSGRLLEWFLEGLLGLLALGLAIWLILPTAGSVAQSDGEGTLAPQPAGVVGEPTGGMLPWTGKVMAAADDTFARPWHGEFNNWFQEPYVRLRPGSWGGLRFLNLPVPQGARIYEAYLRLYVEGKGQLSILFFGQAGGKTSDFSQLGPVPRVRTLASRYWQRHNIGDGWRATPDLSQVLQEIVDQPGWQSGDSAVFLLESTAGSLRFAAWDQDPLLGAELYVTYEGGQDFSTGSAATPDEAVVSPEEADPTPGLIGETYTASGTPSPETASGTQETATDNPAATQVQRTVTEPPPTWTPTATLNPPRPTNPPSTPTVTPPSPPTEAPTVAVSEGIAFGGPIQINSSNYVAHHSTYQASAPFIVRAPVLQADRFTRGLDEISRIRTYGEDISDYRIGFGSVQVLEGLLSETEAQRLRDMGVTTLTYNPEGGHTPAAEFDRRFDASESNPIVQFARLAHAYGFRAVWAPLRADADRTGDDALALIYAGGVDGLALQEQRFIESACVDTRLDAVQATVRRHERIAGRSLEVTVQIMSNRCATGDGLMTSCGEGTPAYPFQHCDLFVDGLSDRSLADVLSIWPTGDETSLIETIR
jgi:hypothetical protein